MYLDVQSTSAMKSRSETASSEFIVGPPVNSSLAASVSRSRPKGCPASAPEPSGIVSARAASCSSLSRSAMAREGDHI